MISTGSSLYYHKQPSFEIIHVPFALSASVFAIAEGSHCNLSHKVAVRFLPYNRHTIVVMYHPPFLCIIKAPICIDAYNTYDII